METPRTLKDYDTTELLRELKSRGVRMSGVQIPVVVLQDIDLDEI